MEIHAVGVIGLGTMGAGIAEVFARGGCPVTAVEVDPQALAKGMATLGASLDRAVSDLARRLGKTPVQVTDRVGFVANALLLPYLNHAARLLETGYASREDIDLAMTRGAGLPMGPLALLDLIGLDTSLAILEVLQREFGGTRCTPAPLLRRLTDAGRLGRKTGAGFYEYQQPAAVTADSSDFDAANGAAAPGTVTLIDPAAGPTVSARGDDPPDPPVSGQRAAETVGLHLVSDGLEDTGLAELVPSPLTSARALSAARELVAKLGRTAVLAPDRPGLLVGGLLYPHLRDAAAMVADGYATPADIDAAMTLGCGYPRGPIRLLVEIGLEQAVEVLDAMHAGYGDPAFAPPPMLRQYAQAGLALAGPPGDHG
ncbi:MAG TPA: 3-hydroxyacyl-CoA dehydrogenase family protein [Streptosporangiaceae bacterium]|nr:3-hydroxyacyl-CoA dehydrogenase family protein [Streptosporangiaceae bacterium]